jgi:RsiW-degrading membrane proteinase PrsW (M82 family)
VLPSLRWLLPALIPCALFAGLAAYGSRRAGHREPLFGLITSWVLGAIAAGVALYLTERAAALTGLEDRTSAAGRSGALIFLFLVVTPLREAGEVAAVWPAMITKRTGEPFDGVVHAAAAALGFAAVETGVILHNHAGGGAIWIARALLALPARVFCASLWGYALGRSKYARRRASLFPAAFLAATIAHGLYGYFVYRRGPGALIAVTPLLAAMAIVAWLLGRDLVARVSAPPGSLPPSSRRRGLSGLSQPPSLGAVRAALRRDEEPIRLGWIAFGTIVVFGGMIVGLAAGVAAAHALHVDLATVDEADVGAAAPVALLGVGLLASFPTSGWLVARAAGVRTLLEPAIASVLALLLTLVTLGFAAPSAVVFALAISPVAWLLSCIGAWIGRVV